MKKPIRFHTLHTQLIASFAVLLLITQVTGLLVINKVLNTSAIQDIRNKFTESDLLYNFLNRQENQKLTQAASILLSDDSFRAAVITADQKTIKSALLNHGARIDADVMLLLDTDGNPLAGSDGVAGRHYQQLLKGAATRGYASGTVLYQGQLLQLVVVPVQALAPIGWLVSGFIIDNKYALSLHGLMGLDVSFLARSAPTGTWEVLATSMPAALAGKLPLVLPDQISPPGTDVFDLYLDKDHHLAYIPAAYQDTDSQIAVIFQQSLQNAFAPLQQVQMILVLLSGIFFVLLIMASNWIARGITRPLAILSSLATRIQHGDYTQSISFDRQDEIGQLATAFTRMGESLAVRESKITELANQDPLTGMPNRTLFLDRLGQAIQATRRLKEPVTVMLMDLDRFKEINDILGHHIGDQLLQEIGRRLRKILQRATDSIARLGGDEFGLLLLGTDSYDVQVMARNILDYVSQPLFLEGQKIIVNASIGIVSSPRHSSDINTLLRQAELAMYAAKQNTTGYVIFDPSLDIQSHHHLSLMAELQQAVTNNEFTLYYQPKVDVTTGAITRVEGLLRWNHATRGLVMPDHFIPFAENTGFIRNITHWAIEHATHQRREWQQLGVQLAISVNISTRDLLTPGLPDLFARMIEAYGAAPDWVEVEITESAIMTNPQKALEILSELRRMGVRMSVDDFGTGHSSFAYLKKLPVQELKIDKSFVNSMAIDNDGAAIVHSIIAMAHNLELTVVAEGVEDKATWDTLQDWGCDFIQGYYVSRPLPAGALEQWLKSSPWGHHRSNPK